MGFFLCIEKSNIYFNTSYTRWNNIRKLLLDSCLEYMNLCQNDINFQNIKLNELLNEVIKLKDKTICESNEVLFKNYSILQFLKIEGIYHLLKKSDNNGKYSYSESELILQMMEIIKYFIIKDESYLKDIEHLKNLFLISYENKKDILIK